MKKRKLELIWAISLMIIGVVSLIYGIINIIGFEVSHTTRIVIAVIQIIVGTVFLVATVLKLKKQRKSGRK